MVCPKFSQRSYLLFSGKKMMLPHIWKLLLIRLLTLEKMGSIWNKVEGMSCLLAGFCILSSPVSVEIFCQPSNKGEISTFQADRDCVPTPTVQDFKKFVLNHEPEKCFCLETKKQFNSGCSLEIFSSVEIIFRVFSAGFSIFLLLWTYWE